jgi:hypothetical protein
MPFISCFVTDAGPSRSQYITREDKKATAVRFFVAGFRLENLGRKGLSLADKWWPRAEILRSRALSRRFWEGKAFGLGG